MSHKNKQRVLCFSESPSQLREMCAAISAKGYDFSAASSPEQAVANCIGNRVVAVALGTESITEMGCSAAQSIKMARPDLPVLLLEQGHDENVPHGISAVATTVSIMAQKLVALLDLANELADIARPEEGRS